MEPLLMEQRGAPFDLTFIVFEIGDRLTASFRYNSDLFDAATISRMAGHFETLLDEVLAHPGPPLSQLRSSPRRRRRMLVDWNRTRCSCSRRIASKIFSRNASARHRKRRHFYFEEQTISYGELNRRANQLARHLQGVGTRAAISLPLACRAVRISSSPFWPRGRPARPTCSSIRRIRPKRLAGMVQDADDGRADRRDNRSPTCPADRRIAG